MGRGISRKLGTEFSVTFSTSPFYLWKRTKRETSRELVVVWQIPLDVSISTFGDLSCNSYVWFMRARKCRPLCVKWQYCLFWSHLSEECLQNTTNGLGGSLSRSDRINQEHRWTISKSWTEDIARTNCEKKNFMSTCVNAAISRENPMGTVSTCITFWLGSHFDVD